MSKGPLADIRIIEVCHMLAGPYCGMLLADLGAEVIKVEMPPAGDIARGVGIHTVGDHNVYFSSLNRNKKSVTLDLASPEGQARLGALARSADGLITNLRPAAIRKLGLTYADLKVHNPRIACLALTGFGLEGPYSDRPAYDYIIQAMVGLMNLTGDPGGPPVKTGYSAVDNSSGIMGGLALLAMLIEGRGGQLDVCLYDVMLSQMNYLAGAYLNAGEIPARQRSGGHPYFVPAQIFATKDGHIALFISHDAFWRKFARGVRRPEWIADRRFGTVRARYDNREYVLGALHGLFRTETTEHWVETLGKTGIVIAGVGTLDEALNGPHVRTREMIAEIPVAGGLLRLVGSPIRISGRKGAYRRPPKLGEHNAALEDRIGSLGTEDAR